jgi:hypothetical protein
MASFDLYNDITVTSGLNIGAISTNTTTSGPWIDTLGAYGLTYSILSGTITDGTYTPNLQESDSDAGSHSDASNVSTDFVIGTYADATFVAADDNTAKKLGYAGKKRYVRLQLVSTGVTTGGTLSASAIVGIPRHAPTDPGER